MRRKISPESPIYIPLVLNILLLVIVGCVYLYNYTELPTVDTLSKMARASPTMPLGKA
jgi:hypothetical protein